MKIFISILFICLFESSLCAKNFVDMLGREVQIPQKTDRVFSASPPMTILLYALAPQKMIGVNYKFYEEEKLYMIPKVKNLPVLGSFYSAGNQANLEKVVSLKPDIVFMWDIVRKNGKYFEEALGRFNIPVVYIGQSSIEDNIKALHTMGVFLKEEKRASELINYAKNNLDRVKKSVSLLKEDEKKSVYFAQGVDGLTSECSGNMQSQIIPLVGATNVFQCDSSFVGSTKKSKITLEKLYTYNPDVIFVSNKPFFDSLNEKSSWRKLKAFKNNQIYFSPISPFNWISRPPSLMRFLGVVWMHNILYPEHFKIKIEDEVKSFYKLFLHLDLNKKEIQNLIRGD